MTQRVIDSARPRRDGTFRARPRCSDPDERFRRALRPPPAAAAPSRDVEARSARTHPGAKAVFCRPAPRCSTLVLLAVFAHSAGVGTATPVAVAQRTELAIPPGTRSLEVVASGAIVRAAPSVRAARRGTVRVGTRLPVEARVGGEGCPGGSWYQVGPEAFICESLIVPSRDQPAGDRLPIVPPGQLLPRTYAFVDVDGTWAYARPQDYFVDEWVESLGRGFGIAVVERRRYDGVSFVRTLRGLWVPEDQLRFAAGSPFQGVEISEGRGLDVAWIARDGVPVYAFERGRTSTRIVRRAGRREQVRIVEDLPGGRVRIEDGVVAARDLIRPPTVGPPAELVSEHERWIDVDVRTQTLVLYEGTRPIFATLVSTGRPGPATGTPTGTYRIWVKLAEDDMDDLERTDVERNYAIEAVPWVQYFAEGVALHAAFWHDDFGRPRSHGCVNLAPRDAARIFELTEPALPPGWDAIVATDAHPGTIVRVRD